MDPETDQAMTAEETATMEELEKLDWLYELDRMEAQSAIIFTRLMQAYIAAFGEEVLDIAERMRWETGVRIGQRMTPDFEDDPAAGLDKHFAQAWSKAAVPVSPLPCIPTIPDGPSSRRSTASTKAWWTEPSSRIAGS